MIECPSLSSNACSDTVSRSGIFCAFMNAMECCKAEGTVDVFQVVRALRIQKPGAVPTVVSQLWHSPHSNVAKHSVLYTVIMYLGF